MEALQVDLLKEIGKTEQLLTTEQQLLSTLSPEELPDQAKTRDQVSNIEADLLTPTINLKEIQARIQAVQSALREHITTLENIQKISLLNDSLRTGIINVTQGIRSLDSGLQQRIFEKVREFNDFNEDNDPYKEHDCAIFEVDGTKVMFKMDYYDKSLQFGSENPANVQKTTRVMTVMLAEEY